MPRRCGLLWNRLDALRKRRPLYAVALALACSAAGAQAPPAPAQELITALSAARARGCGRESGAATTRLRWIAQLDEAARRIARGEPTAEATRQAGYRAIRFFQVSMSGHKSVAQVAKTMATRYCKALVDAQLTDVGFHRRGNSYWVLLAAPFNPPSQSAAAPVSARVLALVNEARSQPRTCGQQRFSAAGPLRHDPLLERAAALHAQDMAQGSYLEHRGRDGSSPDSRATRIGYQWRNIGENIASGQTTAEQVVQDWLRSPEHCANLMNLAFTEMGLAYAVDTRSAAGIYWVQLLGRPK